MNDTNYAEEIKKILKARRSFAYFIEHIIQPYLSNTKPVKHIYEWAEHIQQNKRLALLAPRGHLKSTTFYFYIMWRIFKNQQQQEKWLYISFKQNLAEYHINNIKTLIQKNPYFTELIDLTKEAQNRIRYSWEPGEDLFILEPAGVLSFKRGWHGTGIIADDVLADPAQQLNPTQIQKINRLFFEEIIYLPDPEGYIYLVGTPQHREDLFFQLKEKKDLGFFWRRYPAILNEKEKKVLWPEQWPYKELIKQRQAHPKAFAKEMMVEPVWEQNTYLNRESVLKAVNPKLKEVKILSKEGYAVYAGYDIGKKQHPSHVAIFLYDHIQNKLIQLRSIWMDGWDYIKQIQTIKSLINQLKIDFIYYDATRGELESLKEQGIIDSRWRGINLNLKRKHELAANMDRLFNEQKIELLNDQRQINQLFVVNIDLEALETAEGHGDSFWSIALACYAYTDNEEKGTAFARARPF